MNYVTVIKGWSTGASESVAINHGDTLGTVCAKVGAPSGCICRVNGASATSDTVLGNGDNIVINAGKVAAGQLYRVIINLSK